MGSCHSSKTLTYCPDGSKTQKNKDIRAVDLLLVLTKAAAIDSRAPDILTPLPTRSAGITGVSKSARLAKAAKVAELLPRAVSYADAGGEAKANIQEANDGDATMTAINSASGVTANEATPSSHVTRFTVRKIAKANPRAQAFKLAHWIRSSASHITITPLCGSTLLPAIGTNSQFLLKHRRSTELKFAAARKLGKTQFAFHGSPLCNWHSILRNGLFVASGTKLQLNGTAHGKGIYCAPALSTALGYARKSTVTFAANTPNPQGAPSDLLTTDANSKSLQVVALIEIVGTIRKSGGIWVVPTKSQVMLRHLLVFTGNATSNANTANMRADILANIKKNL